MIDWVHSLANDWGHWVRKSEAKHGTINGTLGRIRDEGLDGAAIRMHGQKIPIVDFPEDVSEFHQAWLRLEGDYSNVIWVDYKLRKPAKEKFEILGKQKDAYYRLRSNALAAVMFRMAKGE